MFRRKPKWTGLAEIEAEERRIANRPSIRFKRWLKKIIRRGMAPYKRLPAALQLVIGWAFWLSVVVTVVLLVKMVFMTMLKVLLSLFILALFGAVIFGGIARLFSIGGSSSSPRKSLAQSDAEYFEEMSDQKQWEDENL